jgi:translation initiation factor 2 alpha subunit (eIF-2alpha)
MAERKPDWPEASDLVIATEDMVADCGAYAELGEYGKRRLLHAACIAKLGGQSTFRREK